MIQTIAITDVTRMEASRVCVAGYSLKDGRPVQCIRPEFRFGSITENWLYQHPSVMRPFSTVELDLIQHAPKPPHTEDWLVDSRYRIVEERLSDQRARELLAALADRTVAEIFCAEVLRN